jgi:site-specific DNA-methyltransferase (adenine-specific)
MATWVRVEHGDLFDVLPCLALAAIRADAIVTDPPYGLEFMGKEWDAPWQVSSRSALFGKRERQTPGWSVTRNANCRSCGGRLRGVKKCKCLSPDWDEAPDSTRTRQMVGYQEWCEEWARAVLGILKPGGYLLAFGGTRTHHRIWCAIEDAGFVIQDTISWMYGSGFPKGKTQLKPAWEPICIAYKPGGKRTLQVDECRIPAADGVPKFTHRGEDSVTCYGDGKNGSNRTGEIDTSTGRWPANVCHDGSDEVMEAFAAFEAPGQFAPVNGHMARDRERPAFPRGDFGSPARFYYCAKATVEDRWGSRHPTVKPAELLKWLVPLVTPKNGLVIDIFAGSGTTGVAALATGRNAILIERDAEYIEDIHERLAFYQGEGNHSPVAKNRHRRRETAGSLL